MTLPDIVLRLCAIICTLFCINVVHSKVFTRCELGQTLLNNKFNYSELGDWICLAERCSSLNSSFHKSYNTTNSTLYGLFTLSNKWWCSDKDYPDTSDCGMPCSSMLSDDLTDTLKCARTVAAQKPYFGNWNQYNGCKGRNLNSIFIEGCEFEENPGTGSGASGSGKSFILPVALSFASITLLGTVLGLVHIVRKRCREKEFDELADYITRHKIKSGDIVLDKTKILGQGNFGIVYGGQYKTENVAFKTMKDDRDSISLLYELKVLAFLEDHPFIIRLLGIYTDTLQQGGKMYLVVEKCQLGNLHDYLESHRNNCLISVLVDSDLNECYKQTSMHFMETEFVSLGLMLTWSFQIADAMDYLANKNVIHGDLAIRNVLLKDLAHVKLTDFGLSKKLYTDLIYLRTQDKEVPWRWLPPEALTDNKYSTQSDTWSFGVTLWEIFSLAQLPYPYMSLSEYMKKIQDGLRLEQPNAAPDELYEVMCTCWAYEPEARPAFASLREKLFQYFSTNRAHWDWVSNSSNGSDGGSINTTIEHL